MSTITVALLFAALLGVPAAQGFTWEPCDKDAVPFIPDQVALTPDPPVIGNQVLFNIVGQNNGACPAQSPVLCCMLS